MFKQAQDLDPKWGAGSLNYSSLPLRDMHMFKEARERNTHALEIISVRGAWGMAEMEASIDIVFTDIAEGELGRAKATMPGLWDAAINGKAWRPWLGGGRLALAQAQVARDLEEAPVAAEVARDALARAMRNSRAKYEALARSLLGQALLRLGDPAAGVREMRRAVALADRLGAPTGRWEIRVPLYQALYATGDDNGAAAVHAEAAQVAREYADTLRDAHREPFLNAVQVRDLFAATTTH